MSQGRVVGVGSPFGEDRLGWVVVERLTAEAEPWASRVRIEALDRPGPALVAALEGAAFAVIVDAVRAGSPPGTVHRVTAADALPRSDPLSSHGLGLAEALALGERLGQLPPWVVVGVEAGGAVLADDRLLDRAAAAVRREVAAFADSTGEAG